MGRVMFVLTGSSGSGKTATARALSVDRLRVHDSDEVGVPEGADTKWRQRSIEHWIRATATLDGDDLLVTGQWPLGEVLAAPSAPCLDSIAVALLQVEDRARWLRLEERDPGKWSAADKRSFVEWARWHTAHAADPGHARQILTTNGWSAMRWSRWADWTAEDPRWRTEVIDTTERSIDDCAQQVARWIARVRADAGWPLRRGWHNH